MSQLDKLRSARNSTSVQFMTFMKVVSKNRDILVCFFEGEDEKYFSVRINSLRPDLNWTGINCAGKSNVISLKQKITTHIQYKNSFVAFFIDNDFDDENVDAHPSLYITPCYSIENIYVNIDCYKNIISAEFGMSEFCCQSNDFDIAVSMFENRLFEFCELVLPFNIWIKAHRNMEKNQTDNIGKLNLNNIKIEDLVNISLTEITSIYDKENINALFPNSKTVALEDYDISKSYFRTNNAVTSFRGKQQLEFLRVFLTKLREERSKKESVIFSKRTSIKLQLTKANILSELSQYAITPNCLRTFLNKLSLMA